MNLADCIRLAEFAHFHQEDKAGFAYIEHPKRVLANVQTQGAPPYAQMAAILHDVTEDTKFTPQMLLDLGVPDAAVNLVRLLDRGESEEVFCAEGMALGYEIDSVAYKAKRDRYYYEAIKQNPFATMVKLADIGDNLQPWRLSYLPPETQARLQKKYAKAIELLNPRPVNHGMLTDWQYDPFKKG
jgi:(p)ppGpp synthase/HD superfamily hydrolase